MEKVRLKYLCSSYSTPITQDEIKEEGLYPVYGASGLVGYKNEYACKQVYLGIIKDGAGVGRIDQYEQQSSLLGTMAYIVPAPGVNISWLRYAIMGMNLGKDISATTIPHIYFKDYGNRLVPFIDQDEQRRIADFLDRRCAEIDRVIDATQQTIEEYKALKQSIITEAVTKGIRRNRQMKESGIEWIGPIPEKWSLLRKLSYAVKKSISYGIVKLFDPDDENGVMVLRCSDVREGSISTENIRTVTQAVSNDYKRTLLEGGEVLINVRGTLGGCAVVPYDMKGFNIAREVAMVSVSKTLHNRFLMYYFLSNVFKTYEEKHLAGSVYIGLNIEMLSACPVPLPSLSEQIAISDYLDNRCNEINQLIAAKQQLLSELESYKNSIIFEYVTGKKAATK